MRPQRIAIIGTGMIAAVHARAARAAGASVVGILGSSASRSADAALALHIPRGYADLEALLDDRPDVVHVCSPNATHAAYVRAVIAAGVHVVCEKPLGMDAAEASELARLARAAGIVATVPFVYRFHPMVREIRARRLAGEFGRLLLAHGTYLQDWMHDPLAASWRVDPATGGRSRAFADIGSHWCDLIEFVTGEQLVDVDATLSIAYEMRPLGGAASFGGNSDPEAALAEVTTEDTAVVTFRTGSGVPVNAVISQVAAGRKNRVWFELDGTTGSAAFDQEHPDAAWFGTPHGAQIVRRGEGRVSREQARFNRFPAGHAQGWGDAFDAFVDDTYAAISGEDVDGLPTFDDGARSASIVDAVLEAAETGARTVIPAERAVIAR